MQLHAHGCISVNISSHVSHVSTVSSSSLSVNFISDTDATLPSQKCAFLKTYCIKLLFNHIFLRFHTSMLHSFKITPTDFVLCFIYTVLFSITGCTVVMQLTCDPYFLCMDEYMSTFVNDPATKGLSWLQVV